MQHVALEPAALETDQYAALEPAHCPELSTPGSTQHTTPGPVWPSMPGPGLCARLNSMSWVQPQTSPIRQQDTEHGGEGGCSSILMILGATTMNATTRPLPLQVSKTIIPFPYIYYTLQFSPAGFGGKDTEYIIDHILLYNYRQRR